MDMPEAQKAEATRKGKQKPDASVAATLLKGLDILGCFMDGDECLTNGEIAARLSMGKATVSRMCKTLLNEQYLRRSADGGFRLGPRILALSYPMLASMTWRQQAMAIISDVANVAQGNVSLSTFGGPNDAVMIQTSSLLHDFPHVPETGMIVPLVPSSIGSSLISMLDDEKMQAKLDMLRNSDPSEFAFHEEECLKRIESCKTRGYCTNYGNWRKAIYSAAAPVGTTRDGLPIVISCGVPAFRGHRDEIENDLGPRIKAAAESLQQMRTFQP